ncbi:transglutaminase-like domain-containing protein, partial [bacterium]|nr:transglutaminase-like domain-containing protein [bacterium]
MIRNSEREIQALITLLGDDNAEIHHLAWEKLLSFGAASTQLLRDAAFSDSEGRVRIAAQALLEEIRLDGLARRFAEICRGSIFDLERSCFLLAQIEYPDLNTDAYAHKIESLAARLERRIFKVQGDRDRIATVNRLLFEEEGFRGNVHAYFDPANSYINKVIDRGLGIPISLSAIYLFLARRLDLPINGVGFPGHFLLRYESGADPIYIDAFHGGKILTRSDCDRYLAQSGYPFSDTYLSISSPKLILARMIRNLVL